MGKLGRNQDLALKTHESLCAVLVKNIHIICILYIYIYHYSHSVDICFRGEVIMINYGMNDGELFEVAELSYGW